MWLGNFHTITDEVFNWFPRSTSASWHKSLSHQMRWNKLNFNPNKRHFPDPCSFMQELISATSVSSSVRLFTWLSKIISSIQAKSLSESGIRVKLMAEATRGSTVCHQLKSSSNLTSYLSPLFHIPSMPGVAFSRKLCVQFSFKSCPGGVYSRHSHPPPLPCPGRRVLCPSG